MENTKPRLGVLALMLEGYEPLFPGITRRQTDYVSRLLERLSGAASFTFPGPAVNAAQMDRLVARFNAEGQDGILILLLSYAQGQYLAHALQHNHLPLALALVQPDETATPAFGELAPADGTTDVGDAVELSAENKRQLFVPRGFAHGFSVLSDEAVFQYKCDNPYAPESEGAVAWNDPAIGIDWRLPPDEVILSPKDSCHPLLADCGELFDYKVDYYA